MNIESPADPGAHSPFTILDSARPILRFLNETRQLSPLALRRIPQVGVSTHQPTAIALPAEQACRAVSHLGFPQQSKWVDSC
jgi:hypothetical protein